MRLSVALLLALLSSCGSGGTEVTTSQAALDGTRHVPLAFDEPPQAVVVLPGDERSLVVAQGADRSLVHLIGAEETDDEFALPQGFVAYAGQIVGPDFYLLGLQCLESQVECESILLRSRQDVIRWERVDLPFSSFEPLSMGSVNDRLYVSPGTDDPALFVLYDLEWNAVDAPPDDNLRLSQMCSTDGLVYRWDFFTPAWWELEPGKEIEELPIPVTGRRLRVWSLDVERWTTAAQLEGEWLAETREEFYANEGAGRTILCTGGELVLWADVNGSSTVVSVTDGDVQQRSVSLGMFADVPGEDHPAAVITQDGRFIGGGVDTEVPWLIVAGTRVLASGEGNTSISVVVQLPSGEYEFWQVATDV